MLDIQGIICHGQVIHTIIKSNMGGQFNYMGIEIIVEHISGGMWIIYKEELFGNMVFQIGFSLKR